MRSKCKARRVAKDDNFDPDIDHVTDTDQSDEDSQTQLFIAEDPLELPLVTVDEYGQSENQSSVTDSRKSSYISHEPTGQLKWTSFANEKAESRGQPESYNLIKEQDDGRQSDEAKNVTMAIPDLADVDFVMKMVNGKHGIWTNIKLEAGKTIGPLMVTNQDGVSKSASINSDSDTLMKYIQHSDNTEISNLMAVSLQNQLYYRAIREIQAGEEMLLYAKDKLFQDKDVRLFSPKTEEGESLPCSECGEIFKNRVSLQRHQLYSCNNSRTFQEFNGMGQEEDFKSEDPRTFPEDVPENAEEGEFKCDECPRSFALKSNLARHQIVHESGRRYACEHCDRNFTDPSNLQRHIRSQHHGARCHACSECGKTFATSSGLKQHQHIHSSVKPFQCEVCLKAYTQFSNLCRHKRMHADCRQQIKCNDCGQAFSTITSLSKHKRFCEGALRSGMRLGNYGGSDSKLSPSAGFVGGSQQPSFSPAMMMGLYGARATYPFYHPTLASLPMFSAGHPLAALTSLSPNSTRSNATSLTPEKSDLSPAGKYEKRLHDGSEGGSEVMSGSDLDNIPSDSESEKSASHNRPSSAHSTGSIMVAKPTPYKPQPTTSPVHVLSPRPSSLQTRTSPLNLPTAFTKVGENDRPFDLTKATEQDHVTPHTSPVSKEETTSSEQPLDLSRGKDITPPEAPRKTHVFGDQNKTPVLQDTPSKRLHYAYPQYPSQLMIEQALRMKETKDKSPESSTYMSYTRFPFSSPPQYPVGVNPFGFVSRESSKAVTSLTTISPQTKTFPDFTHSSPQYSTPNKLKDRYSCKFCGKIFPRSANLTRHLRTHTGEQPYKCKYCERSFSISSNLQRHVRNIHNKEKPFRCPLCDRCFGQQTNLDRHLKKHETDGLNIADSPEHIDDREHELEDKDEAYFSEIRNFIGKSTTLNPDINQNSMSLLEMKQKMGFLATSRVTMENEKMEEEEEMEEEIDPVSDDLDIDYKSVKSDKIDSQIASKAVENVTSEPLFKKQCLREECLTSTGGTVVFPERSSLEVEKRFSPVMCS